LSSTNKKLLITGSQGMFASDLTRVASEEGYEVIGLPHGELDVTDAEQVRGAIEGHAPDLVVNTPGANVDACEEQPEVGYRLHTWAGQIVARQCQRTGAAFVYMSTCGLFGDENRAHSEYDPVELKTQYARSKYLGEQVAREACDRTLVIRPGWLFGGDPEHQRNFVYQRYLEAQRQPVLRSASDKFGSPTNTGDLAKIILKLANAEEYGLYHVTNQGSGSRYDYVKCIVEAFGLDNQVEPIDSSAFPRSAPVPDCEILEDLNLKFLGLAQPEPWQEAIHRYAKLLQSHIA
jgi:dTDP-4-dehydrorhamnose reductase